MFVASDNEVDFREVCGKKPVLFQILMGKRNNHPCAFALQMVDRRPDYGAPLRYFVAVGNVVATL